MHERPQQFSPPGQPLMDAAPCARLWHWLVICLVFGGASAVAASNVQGSGDFEICQSCHGIRGEGIQTLQAPRIAGLDSAYVARQLTDFRQGRRGAIGENTPGRQMAAMAKTLSDDSALERVSAYIEALPGIPAPATISGNVAAGRTLFTRCVACHGVNAEGGASAGAPRLAAMSDWYLLRQLEDFRAGRRGGENAEDGAVTMRSMALTLPTDASLLDVIAYIASLKLPSTTDLLDLDFASFEHRGEMIACGG